MQSENKFSNIKSLLDSMPNHFILPSGFFISVVMLFVNIITIHWINSNEQIKFLYYRCQKLWNSIKYFSLLFHWLAIRNQNNVWIQSTNDYLTVWCYEIVSASWKKNKDYEGRHFQNQQILYSTVNSFMGGK